MNDGYFNDAISQLQQAYEMNRDKKYSSYPPEANASVFYAWQISQTLKILIDTSMLNEDLTLNVDIEGTLEIGQATLQLLSGETTSEVILDDNAAISAEEAAKLTEYGKDYDLCEIIVVDASALKCFKKAVNADNAEAMYLYSR